jgi:hypothetical protein
MRRTLALGLGARRLQACYRCADAVLDPVQGVVVETTRQPRE